MRERQSLFTMVRVGTVMAARAVSLAACLSVTHTAGVTPTARSAAAARCPAASYGARSYAPGGAKTVALTFDDGPGQSTAAILAILARYRVPATFFNIGVNMAARPSLVRAEVKGGYAMGNHTWNHPDLDDLTTAQQAAELDEVIAEQRSITGTVPCAFRPPYGDYDPDLARALRQAGRLRSARWDSPLGADQAIVAVVAVIQQAARPVSRFTKNTKGWPSQSSRPMASARVSTGA